MIRVPGWLKFTVAIILGMGLVVYSTQRQLYRGASESDELDKIDSQFVLPLVNSQGTFDLQRIKGQLGVVNFWASWCEPCLAEFPTMIEFAERYPNITIIGVSVDEDANAMKKFLKSFVLPRNFLIVHDPTRKTAEKYGTVKLPETYVLNKDLKIVKKIVNAHDWLNSHFVSIIENLPH